MDKIAARKELLVCGGLKKGTIGGKRSWQKIQLSELNSCYGEVITLTKNAKIAYLSSITLFVHSFAFSIALKETRKHYYIRYRTKPKNSMRLPTKVR